MHILPRYDSSNANLPSGEAWRWGVSAAWDEGTTRGGGGVRGGAAASPAARPHGDAARGERHNANAPAPPPRCGLGRRRPSLSSADPAPGLPSRWRRPARPRLPNCWQRASTQRRRLSSRTAPRRVGAVGSTGGGGEGRHSGERPPARAPHPARCHTARVQHCSFSNADSPDAALRTSPQRVYATIRKRQMAVEVAHAVVPRPAPGPTTRILPPTSSRTLQHVGSDLGTQTLDAVTKDNPGPG